MPVVGGVDGEGGDGVFHGGEGVGILVIDAVFARYAQAAVEVVLGAEGVVIHGIAGFAIVLARQWADAFGILQVPHGHQAHAIDKGVAEGGLVAIVIIAWLVPFSALAVVEGGVERLVIIAEP